MASGTLQIRSRHTESSVCLDAVRHDACETWCDHAGGSESGLRAWELDVGEWERASEAALVDAVKVQSDDEYGTDFFLRAVCSCVLVQTVPLFEQLCCNGVIRPAILEHVSAGNGTADDDKRVESRLSPRRRGEGPRHTQKTGRNWHKQHRHQHLQELW